MVKVRPFKGLRPPRNLAERVSCLPYDVMSSAEAAIMAGGDPVSLLNITRAEICCPGDVDPHSDEVYDKALENFLRAQAEGWLRQDDSPSYYVYEQTMNGRTQTGIVGAASCEDYRDGLIKKHELTRPDKEDDRMVLTRKLKANIEPVFLAYKAVPELESIMLEAKNNEAEYDFTSPDAIRHRLWVVNDPANVLCIERLFATKVDATYVADGHHRTAAAARIGEEFAKANPRHTGLENYNFFMAVIFPDSELRIMDYNRVVKDLNSMTSEEFIAKVSQVMDLRKQGPDEFRPTSHHEFSMYVDGEWYRLSALPGSFNDSDPIGVLDASILTDKVLRPILGIEDMRRSKRIDFVGGIRGLGELRRRVDEGEAAVAFALYPVSMKQLIDIADTGNIMPPKTTWFEPKLRSGLFIKRVDNSEE